MKLLKFKYRSLLKIKSVDNKKNYGTFENSLNRKYDFMMIEKMQIKCIV